RGMEKRKKVAESNYIRLTSFKENLHTNMDLTAEKPYRSQFRYN
ncbi:hypothetical protein M2105_006383, partial [Paenibacillus sp. PastF-1]|nr:hypothetical protein [Paenibacillus sp. PastF-2]MDF9851921.1 hypothetical protein [Paenibacillus sp. PastM-2]MDF9858465.1 hypothetical protein [Paenibacillus sp. PastF-1]MDH6483751.1 hypothetical protein [Paenibacillus sp. PastH-2]MDH6511114.1 hypothetical protein [Paenibacillus sp. PastM-3]